MGFTSFQHVTKMEWNDGCVKRIKLDIIHKYFPLTNTKVPKLSQFSNS